MQSSASQAVKETTGDVQGAQSGPNFTVFHAGPFDELKQYAYELPQRGVRAEGKLFLGERLGLSGAEVSLNRFPPGRSVPWLHRHNVNEELYIVVRGRGQMQIDGQTFDVREGSAVRVSPAGARTWRNNSDGPLDFLVIQYRSGSDVGRETSDGAAAPGAVIWPQTGEHNLERKP